MPFLRAGFNARNYSTGIMARTAPLDGRAPFAPAELRRFECGDYFWYGDRFLAWPEQCSVRGFDHLFRELRLEGGAVTWSYLPT